MAEKNKILVVDDDYSLRTSLTARLSDEGYDTSPAVDGEEAINILQSQYFDLILLDLTMPKVDGYDVLKFVKEKHPTTKVIMLTAFSELKNAIEAKKLGAEDFGCFLELAPGAMFALGTDNPNLHRHLHSPDFDMDESAMPVGTAIFVETALRFLRGQT